MQVSIGEEASLDSDDAQMLIDTVEQEHADLQSALDFLRDPQVRAEQRERATEIRKEWEDLQEGSARKTKKTKLLQPCVCLVPPCARHNSLAPSLRRSLRALVLSKLYIVRNACACLAPACAEPARLHWDLVFVKKSPRPAPPPTPTPPHIPLRPRIKYPVRANPALQCMSSL